MTFTARFSISRGLLNEQETHARWVEFERSIAHEAALVESASSRLAATANKTSLSAVDPGGDALVTACVAVGQAMGIDVRSRPAGGQGLVGPSNDPLGDLARTGGFHVRPVVLPEGWWRRNGGDPLLGRLVDDGQAPVALVPVRSGTGWFGPAYEIHDSQGCRQPVDLDLARQSRSHGVDVLQDTPGPRAGRVRPRPLQPEHTGAKARARDDGRHGRLGRAPGFVDSRLPPASSSIRCCRKPIFASSPSSACSSWS